MKEHSDVFRIDEACVQFDRSWTDAESPPQIDQFLESLEPTFQSELLRHLISIDVDYRKRRGLPSDLEHYTAALPQHEVLLRNLLEQTDSQTLTSATRPPSYQRLQPILASPGDMIGPYEIVRKIGEGGMGVVYLAQQREPIERQVALKVIKAGLDTEQVIARFEAERQALALMDHPNIARVLDAGATQAGRPFFVMEYVDGVPVNEYCDQQQLHPDQRLDLFVPLCHALQHAHQKGIIHRDIKPSNVLVTAIDGRAVPKVIDFGLAKATGIQPAGRTVFTRCGELIGTFEYMSPEQTRLDRNDIDTRSDVYSLGVLLYELLSGLSPFDKHRMRSAAFDEAIRIIREEEPPVPSARLSGSYESPSIAAVRNLEPRKLSTLLQGDLDWIVMKCLEKDRVRRYESAAGLADDIRRYLREDPVLATPPSTLYRVRKFIRRHRVTLSMAATIVVVLTLATITTLSQRIRMLRAESHALSVERDAARDQLRQSYVANGIRELEQDNNFTAVSLFARALSLRENNQEDAVADRIRLASTMLDCPELLTIQTFDDEIAAISYSPDGNTLVTASGPHAMLWDTDNWEVKSHLTHKSDVKRVAFSRNGRFLAAVTVFEKLHLWDLETNTRCFEPFDVNANIGDLRFSPDGKLLLVVGWGSNDLLVVIESQTGKLKFPAVELGQRFKVRFSDDGSTIVGTPEASMHSSKLELASWDTQTGHRNEGTVISGEFWGARALLSPDSDLLYANGFVPQLHDLESGRPSLAIPTGEKRVANAAFSPDSRLLASTVFEHSLTSPELTQGNAHCEVVIVNTRVGQSICSPLRHSSSVTDVSFSPMGNALLTISGKNGTARVWDPRTGSRLTPELPCRFEITAGMFSPDESQIALAAGEQTGELRVWAWQVDGDAPSEPAQLTGKNAILSPECKRVLCLERDAEKGLSLSDVKAVVANVDNPTRVIQINHAGSCRQACFSIDGRSIVTGCSVGGLLRYGNGEVTSPVRSSVVRVWSSSTGDPITRPLKCSSTVRFVQFSHDAKLVCAIARGRDDEIVVWEVESEKLIARQSVPRKMGIDVAEFDRYGNRLLVRGGSSLGILDIATSSLNWIPLGLERVSAPLGSQLRHLAVSSDGRLAVVCGGGSTTQVIDMNAYAIVNTIEHGERIRHVSFSPDSTRVLTTGGQRACVWDAKTGASALFELQHSGQVYDATFALDGRIIVTGGQDSIRIWDGATGEGLMGVADRFGPEYVGLSADHQWLVYTRGSRVQRSRLPIVDWRISDLQDWAGLMSCKQVERSISLNSNGASPVSSDPTSRRELASSSAPWSVIREPHRRFFAKRPRPPTSLFVPGRDRPSVQLATEIQLQGRSEIDQKKYADALMSFKSAQSVWQELLLEDPTNPAMQHGYRKLFYWIGQSLLRQRGLLEAEQEFLRLLQRDPSHERAADHILRFEQAIGHTGLSTVSKLLNRKEWKSQIANAHGAFCELPDEMFDEPNIEEGYREALRLFFSWYEADSNGVEEFAKLKQITDKLEQLATREPEGSDWESYMAIAYRTLSMQAGSLGREAESVAYREKSEFWKARRGDSE